VPLIALLLNYAKCPKLVSDDFTSLALRLKLSAVSGSRTVVGAWIERCFAAVACLGFEEAADGEAQAGEQGAFQGIAGGKGAL